VHYPQGNDPSDRRRPRFDELMGPLELMESAVSTVGSSGQPSPIFMCLSFPNAKRVPQGNAFARADGDPGPRKVVPASLTWC
jgi:hypothetical protein